jgi:hypothetical protein
VIGFLFVACAGFRLLAATPDDASWSVIENQSNHDVRIEAFTSEGEVKIKHDAPGSPEVDLGTRGNPFVLRREPGKNKYYVLFKTQGDAHKLNVTLRLDGDTDNVTEVVLTRDQTDPTKPIDGILVHSKAMKSCPLSINFAGFRNKVVDPFMVIHSN